MAVTPRPRNPVKRTALGFGDGSSRQVPEPIKMSTRLFAGNLWFDTNQLDQRDQEDGKLGKSEDKRAAIIANQAAREKAESPAAAGVTAGKRNMNWAATPPVRPRRGRPPNGFTRK
jgi:hypothetical protein